MAIKDKIPVGMSLPHRNPEPLDMATVRGVAQRAEALDRKSTRLNSSHT